MDPESRAHTALRNSAWSIGGYIVPIFIAAFVTPIIVFGLGTHDYGIYAFLVSIVAILGLIDLGISSAVSRYITKYHGKGDSEKLADLFKTANSLAFIIGATGLIMATGLGMGGHALLSNGIAPQTAMYYVIIGVIFFINAASLVYTVVPYAVQRFDIATKIGTSILISSAIANIIVVKSGGGVMGMLLVQLGVSLATAIFSRIYSKKLLPDSTRFSFSWSQQEVKKLYSFGLQAFTANIGSTLSTHLNRLIIPIFLGPSALTYYTVPGSVSAKIPGLTGAVSGILFPITANLSSLGETEKIKIAYIRSFRLITILTVATASSVIIFAEPILRYWLDESFAARSVNVLILLTLTNFALSLYTPLYNFLLGLGKLKMITIISFLMGGLNAVLLFALLPFFDIEGAAWAYLISVLPIGYMIYHTERKYLKFELRTHYYLKLATRSAIAVFASYLVAHFLWLPITNSFTAILMTGPLSVLTYLVLYKEFGFYEEEDWRDVVNYGKHVFKR